MTPLKSRLMENVPMAGFGGKVLQFSAVSTNLELCKPPLHGFSWKLRYIGMTDDVIGYWQLNSTSRRFLSFPKGQYVCTGEGCMFPLVTKSLTLVGSLVSVRN